VYLHRFHLRNHEGWSFPLASMKLRRDDQWVQERKEL
jgi:hypothetical protein